MYEILKLIDAGCKMYLASRPIVGLVGFFLGGTGGAISSLASLTIAGFAFGIGIVAYTAYQLIIEEDVDYAG